MFEERNRAITPEEAKGDVIELMLEMGELIGELRSEILYPDNLQSSIRKNKERILRLLETVKSTVRGLYAYKAIPSDVENDLLTDVGVFIEAVEKEELEDIRDKLSLLKEDVYFGPLIEYVRRRLEGELAY